MADLDHTFKMADPHLWLITQNLVRPSYMQALNMVQLLEPIAVLHQILGTNITNQLSSSVVVENAADKQTDASIHLLPYI